MHCASTNLWRDCWAYPNETVMEEHPQDSSGNFGVVDRGVVDRLEDDLLGLWTFLTVIIAA